jgi:hypothetical protein
MVENTEEFGPLVQEIRSRFFANPMFLPLDFADEILEFFKGAFAEGSPLDLAERANWSTAEQAYGYATRELLQRGAPPIADTLLQDWWRALCEQQFRTGLRLPLALPAYFLSRVFWAVGDLGCSFRWTFLAYVHDSMSGHPGGQAKQLLRSVFGLSSQDLARVAAFSEQCVQEVLVQGWQIPAGYPEYALQRFMTDERGRTTYAAQAASLPTTRDFPVNPTYLRALLKDMDVGDGDVLRKGKQLEYIGFYLMSLLPGCAPSRNVLDTDRAYETDLIVRNLYGKTNLLSDLFGRHILVECKNWKDPVGVAHVGYFLFRMRLTHARFGIILAPGGITGAEHDEARALIRRSFHEDGSTCIVIERADLEELAGGTVGLYWLLMEKYEAFRFGHPDQKRSGARVRRPRKSRGGSRAKL